MFSYLIPNTSGLRVKCYALIDNKMRPAFSLDLIIAYPRHLVVFSSHRIETTVL